MQIINFYKFLIKNLFIKMENITYENFDWELYMSTYQDLKDAGLNNKNKLWNHWVRYGRREGRKIARKEHITEEEKIIIDNISTENNKSHWIHIYIDDISNFVLLDRYINKIVDSFNVVITYRVGVNKRKNTFPIIKIENGNFISNSRHVISHLERENVTYNFIWFINLEHVKDDLMLFIEELCDNIDSLNSYDLIMLNGVKSQSNSMFNDYCKLNNISFVTNQTISGNFFLASRHLVQNTKIHLNQSINIEIWNLVWLNCLNSINGMMKQINKTNEICILINATSSLICGGTRTVSLLGNKIISSDVDYLANSSLTYLILNLDGYSNENELKKIIRHYSEDTQANYLVYKTNNLSSFIDKNIVFTDIIATFNITLWYASLLNYSRIYYFIQDCETTFYDNENYGKMLCNYSYITSKSKHIIPIIYGNYIKEKMKKYYDLNGVLLNIGVDNNIYYNICMERNGILLVYYKNKNRRLGSYIYDLALYIREKYPNIRISCFPDDMDIDGVNNLGKLTPQELNMIYNVHKLAICFSDTNISRISFEILSSGTPVLELKNQNNLDDNIFFTVEKDISQMYQKIDQILNKNTLEKMVKKLKTHTPYTKTDESNDFCKILDENSKINEKKTKVYIFVSNGNLGSDCLKGINLSEYLSDKYCVTIIPTDKNFNYQRQILYGIISNIQNSIVFFIRSFSFMDKQLCKKLKNQGCLLIFDHVDLFSEKGFFDFVVENKYLEVFDKIICNSEYMRNHMINYVDESKLVTLYHHWDFRYERKFTFKQPTSLSLGFIGCCKRLDRMLCLDIETIRKHNIKLLDSECWKYVNEKVYNNDLTWETISLDDIDTIEVDFNVQVSVRDITKINLLRYKTNLKMSTSALMGQVIIMTKEPANCELLGENYPFYLNDTSVEEFERVLEILKQDFYGTKYLFNLALEMLKDVKEKTSPDFIFKKYISDLKIKLFQPHTEKYCYCGGTRFNHEIINCRTIQKCRQCQLRYDMNSFRNAKEKIQGHRGDSINFPIENYYRVNEHELHEKINKEAIFVRDLLKILKRLNPDVIFDNKTLLDIGCGNGLRMNGFLSHGLKYHAADLDSRIFILHNREHMDKYINIHDIDGQMFDFLFCWHVLEHFDNVYDFINLLQKISHVGTIMLLQVPCLDKKHLFDRHYLFFNEKSLNVLFSKIGYRCIKILHDSVNNFITYFGVYIGHV